MRAAWFRATHASLIPVRGAPLGLSHPPEWFRVPPARLSVGREYRQVLALLLDLGSSTR